MGRMRPISSMGIFPAEAMVLTPCAMPGDSTRRPRGPLLIAKQALALGTRVRVGKLDMTDFENLSPDPDTEYFSDGLTDEIITDLSRVRALRVISRSSAMRLKGDERGLAAIGRDLDCRYVLEGSVRRAANDLRITTRLVDAPDDAQIWSDKYEGTLDKVFDIQERVSRSIVDALEIQLTPREARILRRGDLSSLCFIDTAAYGE